MYSSIAIGSPCLIENNNRMNLVSPEMMNLVLAPSCNIVIHHVNKVPKFILSITFMRNFKKTRSYALK